MLSILLALSAVHSYSQCDPNSHPYSQALAKGQVITATIIPALDPAFSGGVQVSGSLRIIDGCTFQSVGFSLTPPTLNVAWFGGNGTAFDGYSLTDTAVNTRSVNQTFGFKTTAGNAVSYTDFNQFRLVERGGANNDRVIARANIPSQFLNPGVVIGVTPPTATTRITAGPFTSTKTTATPTPGTKSGAITNDPYSIVLVTFIAIALTLRLL